MDTQRLILFVVFSFSALLLWEAWQKEFRPPPPLVATSPAKSTAPADLPQIPTTAPPAATAGAPPAAPVPPGADREAAAAGRTVTITTDLYRAEIDTTGGAVTQVALLKHRDPGDEAKPYLALIKTPERTFVAQSGLLGEGMPNHRSVYTVEPGPRELAPGADRIELKLHAVAPNGDRIAQVLTFRRGTYVIDVAYDITNAGTAPITPYAYFQFTRDTKTQGTQNSMAPVSYAGPVIYNEIDKFKKIDFSDLDKLAADPSRKLPYTKNADNGWVAMVEHYFVAAWLPSDEKKTPREFYARKLEGGLYSAGMIVPVGTIAAGATAEVKVPLYVGPQEQDELARLARGLDLVVDYGIFTVIAAPLFWLLKWLHGIVHNWGWAIVLLTIIIKSVFYPLNHASARSMAKMKVIAPKLKALQEQYANDKQQLQVKMMEMYKQEKINPLGGCLPILVQIPVFIALYWVLLSAVELRNAPWIGWIKDLSAPDPYFVLPVIYAITAYLQVKLSPTPITDPVQAKVMQIMPIAFSVMFVFFPSGLVLYWLVNNSLQIFQQWHMNRVLEKEAALAAAKRQIDPTVDMSATAASKPAPDTIAAISTPAGRGGVGVIRVSGAAVSAVIAGMLRVPLPPRMATHTTFRDGSGEAIDQGLALFFPAPRSYTGEDVLELHGHGGPAVLRLLLARCAELGARLARPGEFTQRAFMNGKLDLAQAESVADLIDAATTTAVRAAARSLSGTFSKEIRALSEALIELRMFVEATLDFPEDGDVFLRAVDVRGRIDTIAAQISGVLARARQGALLREGLAVVLVGRPNVGKSSLLNRLVGDDVAIVTPIAGTTRDAVTQPVEIDGIPLTIIDTAGLRPTDDPIETIGIERTWSAVAKADLALVLVDAAGGGNLGEDDAAILRGLPATLPRLVVHNKIDLTGLAARVDSRTVANESAGVSRTEHHVFLSAKTGAGMELLQREILALADVREDMEDVFLARERHLVALRDAAGHLASAWTHFGAATPPHELVAEDLRSAHTALTAITGEFTSDDLLGVIFSRFCIGK